MSDENSKGSHRVAGKVRWRRFAIVAVPAVAIAGTLVGLTAEGAIASSISVSGQAYTVAASKLTGYGFEQFGGQVSPAGSSTPQPVMVSAMHNAYLTDLCQSVTVGPVTLRLTAGDGGTPVNAQNLIVDADSQTGSTAVFHNISIGLDASTLTGDGVAGPPGGFGEQADSVTIETLRQNTWLTTAGTFTLPNLNLSISFSNKGC